MSFFFTETNVASAHKSKLTVNLDPEVGFREDRVEHVLVAADQNWGQS